MIIAIDHDHTIWDTPRGAMPGNNGKPLPGARDALCRFREAGYEIIIHSCNNPKFVEQCLNDASIPYDSIWQAKGKPVADAYIDDKGLNYHENWPEIVELVKRQQYYA